MRNKILIYVLLGIGSPGLAQWTASLKTARMLEKGGNVEGAIAVYEDILNKNPKNRQAIRDLKSIYKKHQKFDDGIIFLRNLLTCFDLLGCLSFLSAFASICLILSLVTENCKPTSSKV